MVRRNAVSKRQEGRRGHIPGRRKSLRVILSLRGCWFNLHSGKNEVASTPGGRDFMDEIDGFSLRANASSLLSLVQLALGKNYPEQRVNYFLTSIKNNS